MFNDTEHTYLKGGGMPRLARLGTVDADGQPNVDAVGFGYDDGVFTIGTHTGDVTTTRKGRNVRDGRTKVSLVVDDLETVDPWQPRGIRVQGEGEIATVNGIFGPGTYILVHPTITWSWGLDGSVFENGMTRTEWK